MDTFSFVSTSVVEVAVKNHQKNNHSKLVYSIKYSRF